DDDDEVVGDEEVLDGLLAGAAERGLADVAARDLAVDRDPPESGVAGPRCRVGAADEPAAARHGGRGRRPLLAGAPEAGVDDAGPRGAVPRHPDAGVGVAAAVVGADDDEAVLPGGAAVGLLAPRALE